MSGSPPQTSLGPQKRWPTALMAEVVVLIALVCLPWAASSSVGDRFTDLFVFAILALGLNVVVGYTGLLHLGIGAFYGIGAYITGILTLSTNPFQFGLAPALLFATVGAAFAGLVLGAPTLRLRGDYLALVTLGFGEVVKVALRNLEEITNGMQSLGPLPPPKVPAAAAGVLKFLHLGPDFADYRLFYYLALAILVGVVLLLRFLERSRLGRAWVAIREDELAATCMAINAPRVKLSAFALSAALAGMAGCLFATKLTNTANPHEYGFPLSITALCCIILGGLGSIRGVLLGVLLLQGYEYIVAGLLDQWVQGFRDRVVDWFSASFPASFPPHGASVGKIQYLLTFSNWKLMIFGLVLILIVRFRPEGLLPSRRVQHEFNLDKPDSSKKG
jgi:branched-chain amino acid transport system permease protein